MPARCGLIRAEVEARGYIDVNQRCSAVYNAAGDVCGDYHAMHSLCMSRRIASRRIASHRIASFADRAFCHSCVHVCWTRSPANARYVCVLSVRKCAVSRGVLLRVAFRRFGGGAVVVALAGAFRVRRSPCPRHDSTHEFCGGGGQSVRTAHTATPPLCCFGANQTAANSCIAVGSGAVGVIALARVTRYAFELLFFLFLLLLLVRLFAA